MRNGSFRQATILLLVLAILVGPAAGVMSMATATRAMAMTQADGSGACKGCLPEKMPAADCGTVCVSLPAIIAPLVAFSSAAAHSPWGRHDEPVGRYTTKPPTAPPRSGR
jgi:hypothetical protein